MVNGGDPKREAEVVASMKLLDNMIEKVAKGVESLEAKIINVLSVEAVGERGEKPEAGPSRCPLAGAIDKAAATLERINYDLASLTDRVEL